MHLDYIDNQVTLQDSVEKVLKSFTKDKES